jgi:hypothetical protein
MIISHGQPISASAANYQRLIILRRNLTKGQLAIVAGRAWKRAEAAGKIVKEGRPTNSQKVGELITNARDYFADAYGVNHRYAEMGKLIVDQGPEDLAPAVLDGSKKLADAHTEAQQPSAPVVWVNW